MVSLGYRRSSLKIESVMVWRVSTYQFLTFLFHDSLTFLGSSRFKFGDTVAIVPNYTQST